jgi:hypothetical protein
MTAPKGGISEAASKKRGRPRVLEFGTDLESIARPIDPWTRAKMCRRSTVNHRYAALGIFAVRDKGKPAPRYAWFDGPRPRIGVLIELGRTSQLWGKDGARLVADTLMRAVAEGEITTTRHAELWIRDWRVRAERDARSDAQVKRKEGKRR